VEPFGDAQQPQPSTDAPAWEAEVLVRQIGPHAYSLAIRADGKDFMTTVDYFTDEEQVETAIIWIKRQVPGARVHWRKEE
jgi:hypothetical protein